MAFTWQELGYKLGTCTRCFEAYCLYPNGRIARHGPKERRCPGGGKKAVEAR